MEDKYSDAAYLEISPNDYNGHTSECRRIGLSSKLALCK